MATNESAIDNTPETEGTTGGGETGLQRAKTSIINAVDENGNVDINKALVAVNYKGLTGSDIGDSIPATDIVEDAAE